MCVWKNWFFHYYIPNTKTSAVNSLKLKMNSASETNKNCKDCKPSSSTSKDPEDVIFKRPLNVCPSAKKGKQKQKRNTRSIPDFLYEEDVDLFAELKSKYLRDTLGDGNSYSEKELKYHRRKLQNKAAAKKARVERIKRIRDLKKQRKILKSELQDSIDELQAKRHENLITGIKVKKTRLEHLRCLAQYYRSMSMKTFTIPPFFTLQRYGERRRKQKEQ